MTYTQKEKDKTIKQENSWKQERASAPLYREEDATEIREREREGERESERIISVKAC